MTGMGFLVLSEMATCLDLYGVKCPADRQEAIFLLREMDREYLEIQVEKSTANEKKKP